MELVLLIGIQASGKSTFAKERFFRSHLRINLDMIRTRHREDRLMKVCLETRLPFLIDNTNVTRENREKYIRAAKEHGFKVVGYYFQSKIQDCIERNEKRPIEERIPRKGISGASSRLEIPELDEGFDELYYVRIDPEQNVFIVEEWPDSIKTSKKPRTHFESLWH